MSIESMCLWAHKILLKVSKKLLKLLPTLPLVVEENER